MSHLKLENNGRRLSDSPSSCSSRDTSNTMVQAGPHEQVRGGSPLPLGFWGRPCSRGVSLVAGSQSLSHPDSAKLLFLSLSQVCSLPSADEVGLIFLAILKGKSLQSGEDQPPSMNDEVTTLDCYSHKGVVHPFRLSPHQGEEGQTSARCGALFWLQISSLCQWFTLNASFY